MISSRTDFPGGREEGKEEGKEGEGEKRGDSHLTQSARPWVSEAFCFSHIQRQLLLRHQDCERLVNCALQGPQSYWQFVF